MIVNAGFNIITERAVLWTWYSLESPAAGRPTLWMTG